MYKADNKCTFIYIILQVAFLVAILFQDIDIAFVKIEYIRVTSVTKII